MTSPSEAIQELLKFAGALSLLSGAMSWFRKGSHAEDEIIAESADIVINSLSDADLVNRVDQSTGKNLRDQLSVEQAEELDRERTLRRFINRN